MTTAYWCILIAALLPYLWVTVAKGAGARYDNRDPRDWQARQDNPRSHRANAAQLNAFEAFAPFAASVLMAQAADVDPARIAYGVMAGIGFLGAGVIVKHQGGIHGLTTAAGLWCVAAIGLACGMGLYLIALSAAVLVLASLWFLNYVEKFLPKVRYRVLTVRRAWHPEVVHETVGIVEAGGVKVSDASFERIGDLSNVSIRMRIAFSSPAQYFALEQELDRRPGFELLSASSET